MDLEPFMIVAKGTILMISTDHLPNRGERTNLITSFGSTTVICVMCLTDMQLQYIKYIKIYHTPRQVI